MAGNHYPALWTIISQFFDMFYNGIAGLSIGDFIKYLEPVPKL